MSASVPLVIVVQTREAAHRPPLASARLDPLLVSDGLACCAAAAADLVEGY